MTKRELQLLADKAQCRADEVRESTETRAGSPIEARAWERLADAANTLHVMACRQEQYDASDIPADIGPFTADGCPVEGT